MNRSNLATLGPVHLGTALSVLVADWLVLAVNMTTDFGDLALITASGAVLAGVSTYAFERWLGGRSSAAATAKAFLAAVVVAVPMPLAGTLFAVVALTWAFVAGVQQRRAT